jgi:predicted kinase
MNRPRLILLCGIPGSGKTTYAKSNAFGREDQPQSHWF